MMHRTIQILALIFLLVLFCPAQVESIEPTLNQTAKTTEKIGEFGSVGECELGAVMDIFFTELMNNPSASGYVIVYQGADVLPAEYDSSQFSRRIKQTIAFRKFDASRITIVNGGFRDEAAAELFIVPHGASAPKPSRTVAKPALPKNKTYLHDIEYFTLPYGSEDEILTDFILPHVKAENTERERLAEEEWKRENPDAKEDENPFAANQTEAENSIEEATQEELDFAKFFWLSGNFGDAIKRQKGARGVIVFYADDLYYDANKLQTFIEEGRNRTADEAKIGRAKIQVVFGGYRTRTQAEFWVVPKKGAPPIPAPEQREAPDEH
jgi:hypothetical protein